MIKIKILDWQKPSTKIILTVFFGLFVLSGYFIFFINFTFINISETQNLEKLRAIANTLALQINGDKHQILSDKYQKQGELKTNTQDTLYYGIWKKLRAAYDANNLSTEISTLVLDQKTKKFYYIENSTDKPYVRDPYASYHQEFLDDYEKGNVIHRYKDEYGTWLTAFAPIKNSTGKTVAILEVDESFDRFLAEARKNTIKNLIISILIFLVTVIVILRYVRVILIGEEKQKDIIEKSHHEIAQKNKDIVDSINYALKIQSAMLPPTEEIKSSFKDIFILFKPKDIVSGDFYFHTRVGKKILIAVVDCTGHGVPGAMMSMIGNDLLNNIVHERDITVPSDILDNLHDGVIKALKQDTAHLESKDGMDVALMSFDLEKSELQYAGAYRPLYVVRSGAITEYKANKFPIGNISQERSSFTNHTIQLQKDDCIYAFSDGYADQFGGPNGKKFMIKKFQNLLLEINPLPIDEQYKRVSKTIDDWRGIYEQVDDMLVIGIRV
jgi:serine phosphatase RsbU (regulator of sigma subunit)/flavodoxin